MKTNTTLQRLDLSDLGFYVSREERPTEEDLLLLVEALEATDTLRELHFYDYAKFGAKGDDAIKRLFRLSLTHLALPSFYNPNVCYEGGDTLVWLKLDIGHSEDSRRSFIEWLKQHSNLEHLAVSGCYYDDLQQIMAINTLRSLDITHYTLENAAEIRGFQLPSKLETLVAPALDSTHWTHCGSTIVELFLEKLRDNKTLTSLDFAEMPVDDNVAKDLAKVLPTTNIRVLKLNDQPMLGPKGVQALVPELLNVVELQLNRCPSIGDDGALILMCLLEAKDASLRVLQLDDCGIRNTGASALGLALRRNNTLEELRMGNNKIGARGGLMFTRVLKEYNKTLRSLYLDGNRIIDIESFLSFLSENHTLECINISGNGRGRDTDLGALQEALKKYKGGALKKLKATFRPNVETEGALRSFGHVQRRAYSERRLQTCLKRSRTGEKLQKCAKTE